MPNMNGIEGAEIESDFFSGWVNSNLFKGLVLPNLVLLWSYSFL